MIIIFGTPVVAVLIDHSRADSTVSALIIVASLLAVCGVTSVLVIRRGYRDAVRADWRKHGRCPACGYSLTGNVSGVCPECGTRVGGVGGGA